MARAIVVTDDLLIRDPRVGDDLKQLPKPRLTPEESGRRGGQRAQRQGKGKRTQWTRDQARAMGRRGGRARWSHDTDDTDEKGAMTP